MEATATKFGKSLNINNSNRENKAIINHSEIIDKLLNEVKKIDFELLAFPQREKLKKEIQSIFDNEKRTKEDCERMQQMQKKLDRLNLNEDHYLVLTIEEIIKIAKANKWDLCKNQNFIYIYNGAYWKHIDKDDFQKFLGNVAEKMGVPKFKAKVFHFNKKLIDQFLHAAHLPSPEVSKDNVLINLLNGTFEISSDNANLRAFNRKDFIKYQLNFEYNPLAKAPKFEAFLNRVQPDKERQNILSEYLGYIFINSLKLEKALILYGSGANGKSVFFEVVNALLGNDNVCSYSLQNITKYDSYQRAELANKLVNYASEINGKLETSIFKQIVSGEPVEARQIYGKPFTMTNYAKLIFNCNELPKEVEQTHAFFRRFLIVPFDVTIPEEEQNKELAKEIINEELTGVFNWVLEGLKRLLKQKNFTNSDAVNNQLKQYKKNSDSVLMFLDDENYIKSKSEFISLKEMFALYKSYCNETGFYNCSIKVFSERLKNNGYHTERKNYGIIVYIEKQNFNNSETSF